MAAEARNGDRHSTRSVSVAIAHLMRRHAAAAGIDMSVRELLATLAGIQETVLLHPGQRGCPRAQRIDPDPDPT